MSSSSAVSNPTADAEAVKILTSMGFPATQASIALLRADNDISRAADLLSNGSKINMIYALDN